MSRRGALQDPASERDAGALTGFVRGAGVAAAWLAGRDPGLAGELVAAMGFTIADYVACGVGRKDVEVLRGLLQVREEVATR